MAYSSSFDRPSGVSQASMFAGSIGIPQRSWPAAAISAGGSSVIAANDSRSGSPGACQRSPMHANSTLSAVLQLEVQHDVLRLLVGAEVAFTDWTNDGTLRAPPLLGLRKDKVEPEVVRERVAIAT